MSNIFQTPGKMIDNVAKAISRPFGTQAQSNGVLADDYAEGFIFGEVQASGIVSDTFRIRLNGTNMPHQPFQYGGKVRQVKEFYAGNKEANIQIIGDEEKDLTVNGRFHTKKLRNQELYGSPKALCELIDTLRRRGNLLKITLGEWTRYGFLSETDWKEKGMGDIEYSISFVIASTTLPEDFYKLTTTKERPTAFNSQLISDLADFQQEYLERADDTSYDQSLSDKLNGYISDVATVVSAATSFVGTVLSTIEATEASISRAIGLIKFARASLSKFKRRAGLLNIATLISSSHSKRYLTVASTAKALNKANSMQDMLAKIQAQLESIRKTVPKARHLVKNGDTLQKISMKYFNSVDNANKIYSHNKLTSTVLTVGTVLEIPNV